MNFLSHHYFDRHSTDSYLVIGTVLPDLLKNADKHYNIHPEKLAPHPNHQVNSILQGWHKHLEVDRYFHSSDFFAHHSHQLKLVLIPAIHDSPVKPFFLGHIALELILDNLLITSGMLSVNRFYEHLDNADPEIIAQFFIYGGLNEHERFFKFFADFKRHRYLQTYAEAQQIAYALKRVCMRIWKEPFTPAHEENMTGVLMQYRSILLNDYMLIFNEIEQHLP